MVYKDGAPGDSELEEFDEIAAAMAGEETYCKHYTLAWFAISGHMFVPLLLYY